MAEKEIKKTTKKTVKTATKPVTKTVKKETAIKKNQEVRIKNQGKNKKDITVKVEAPVSTKKAERKSATLSIDVVDVAGKVTGKMSLPGEMFGDKVNKALLAQAVRVYLANQRQGTVSTKTRGEVDGSTRKIYRQKGTGRARHGSVRAPIFVKGGIVFGPKPRDFSLSIPQKMKRKALFSALSAKVNDKEVTIIDGLHTIKPKTKFFAQMLEKLGFTEEKQNLLFITSGDVTSVLRAGHNIQGVNFLPSKQINTYEVLAAGRLIVMKDAVSEMTEHFLKK
jgi:large subunit ribosomal protein L4